MRIFEAGHEQIVLREDAATGLRAIIAIHSTRLGPAAGGCRHWAYPDAAAALADALRLSRGMTFKNALADIPFGGGKSVILGTPGRALTEDQLETFGRWIDELQGSYVTAEDVGMGVKALQTVARSTRYVSGLGRGGVGGDPSPFTARGVLRGIEAAVRFRLGRDDLDGLRVAVQGLGSVGMHLCELLHERGARLWVADVAAERVRLAVEAFAAQPVDPGAVASVDVDVLAPCALGGVLSLEALGGLRAPVVAGAANNQLASDEVGDLLAGRGVLYAPDYVINAGGIISVAQEYLGIDDGQWTERRIDGIGERLTAIFQRASRTGEPTSRIADALAAERLHAGGAASTPGGRPWAMAANRR